MPRRVLKSGLPALRPGKMLREDVLAALGRPHAELAAIPALVAN